MTSETVAPRFLKVATLRNGLRVVLRPFAAGDREKILEFFRGLPADDLLSMREDVTDPAVIDGWISRMDPTQVMAIVAEAGDEIVGDGTLYLWPNGWYRHLGEIRLSVAGAHREQGLGTLLLTELFSLALQCNLDKIIAEALREQTTAIAMLERMGFRKEAELRDHVMDRTGRKRDLIILTNFTAVLWDRLADSEDFIVRMNHMED